MLHEDLSMISLHVAACMNVAFIIGTLVWIVCINSIVTFYRSFAYIHIRMYVLLLHVTHFLSLVFGCYCAYCAFVV